MVSGFFDPFHDVHLAYIQYAMNYGDTLLCVVSTDAHVIMKKGSVNIPQEDRLRIVTAILRDMQVPARAVLNVHDKANNMVAEALRYWKPDVFCRGSDKTLEDMPPEERAACLDFGILIVHAELAREAHGSKFTY